MGFKRKFLRLLAVLFAFAMVAAACGGSDSDDDSSSDSGSDTAAASSSDSSDSEEAEEEEDAGMLSQEEVEKAVAGDDDGEEEEVDEDAPTFDRSTLDGIWEEAAYRRQIMIDEITENMESGDWGVGDDNILRGPAGYEADLNNCPGAVSYTHLTLPTKA